MRKPFHSALCFLCLPCLALLAAAGNQGNPANQLTDLINVNRTATKLKKLHNNAGLGCMALQYISQCTGNCSSNNTLSCHPPLVDITEIYAPNCGVELPTVGIISDHLAGCGQNYFNVEQAFSDSLAGDSKAVAVIHGKDLNELGAAFISEKHQVFYWCVLFSNETSNSTFVLEQGGKGLEQKIGCFSGFDVPCGAGRKTLVLGYLGIFISILQASFLLWF